MVSIAIGIIGLISSPHMSFASDVDKVEVTHNEKGTKNELEKEKVEASLNEATSTDKDQKTTATVEVYYGEKKIGDTLEATCFLEKGDGSDSKIVILR